MISHKPYPQTRRNPVGTIIFFVVLVGLALLMREVGHALALWELGIPMRRRMAVSPKSQEMFTSLSSDQQILFFGCGIIANIICGLFFIGLAFCCDKGVLNLVTGISLFVLAVIVMCIRRRISVRFLPWVGVAMVAWYVWRVWHDPLQGIRGPLTIAAQAKRDLDNGESYLKVTGLTFLVLGFFSALPILPLNGGRIMHTLTRLKCPGILPIYEKISPILRLCILGFGVMSEVYTVFGWYST